MERLVQELHKPARRNFVRRRVIVKGFDDLWQADLVDMRAYSRDNKGINYILTIIDVFSKYAWACGIRTKSANDVSNAMLTIFKQGRYPKNLQTDDGKEFFNSMFQALMKKFKVNHYSSFSVLKATVVERFNRTLKENMWKRFSLKGSYEFASFLQSLIDRYNDTIHRTISMKPKDVTKKNEKEVFNRVYRHIKAVGKSRFNVGDKVRISKYKKLFEKGYTPNWTTEIFTIKKKQITDPVTYILKDYRGEEVTGGFYEKELQKVKYDDMYLIQKVLKTDKNKIYVKWLGFDNSHNSWINKSKVVK